MLGVQDRELYTEMLLPPEGYKTERALCLTYSVDLTMLLAVTVSLFMGRSSEGSIKNESGEVLAALQSAEGKLSLFCQQGHIADPKKYNALFQLVENCVRGVCLEKGNFHPKLWLVKYTREEESIYRLLVLSRNLTDTMDWDIICFTEGVAVTYGNPSKIYNPGLIEFLKEIKVHTVADDRIINSFIEELPKVRFSKPEDVDHMEFVGIIPGGKNINYLPGNDLYDLVVISPFVKTELLETLHKKLSSLCRPTLLSKSEELDKLGEEILGKYDCYVLPEILKDGEVMLESELLDSNKADSQDETRHNDLHAKAYFWSKGGKEYGLLGSANATNAAFEINYEAMIRLEFKHDKVLEGIRKNLIVSESGDGLFEKYTPGNTAEKKEDSSNEFREIITWITNNIKEAEISRTGNGFKTVLKINYETKLPHSEKYQVEISPLTLKDNGGYKSICEPEITFDVEGAHQLTALFSVIICNNAVKQDKKTFVIKLEVDWAQDILDARLQQIYKSMFTNIGQLIEHIAWLLEGERLAGESNLIQLLKSSHGNTNSNTIQMTGIPLYEKMLLLAATNSDKLKQIDVIIKSLDREQFEEPGQQNEYDKMIKFWAPFAELIKGN